MPSPVQTTLFDNWPNFPERLRGLEAPVVVWEHLRYLQRENERLKAELTHSPAAVPTARSPAAAPSMIDPPRQEGTP